jgi:hypothetical protein
VEAITTQPTATVAQMVTLTVMALVTLATVAHPEAMEAVVTRCLTSEPV